MRSPQVASKALGVLFATAVLAVAQSVSDRPDALDLLKNVALTYRAMKTFSAKSATEVGMSGLHMRITMTTTETIMADSSGKVRMESTGMEDTLTIFDGSALWMYISSLNKYMKIPPSVAVLSGQLKGGDLSRAAVGGMEMSSPTTNLFLRYRSVASNVKEAKILRSETVHANGSDVDCWVVSVEYEPADGQTSAEQVAGAPAADLARAKTLWVDKTHYVVYRDDSTVKLTVPGIWSGSVDQGGLQGLGSATVPTETRQTINFDSITVDQPIPEGAFIFTPPPGATETDLSSLIPKTLPAN